MQRLGDQLIADSDAARQHGLEVYRKLSNARRPTALHRLVGPVSERREAISDRQP